MIEELLAGTFVSDVRHFPVAVTTEALALGWLRAEDAPHGALVIADQEISARTRLDEPVVAAAINVSVVARVQLPVDHADVLFGSALLAAVDGCRPFEDSVHARWPEGVHGREVVGVVDVNSQLSPGSVKSAVISFRLGLGVVGPVEESLRATIVSLERWLTAQPTEIAAAYSEICEFTDRRIRVELRPRGASGGVGVGIDERGGYGVRSSSGSVSRFRIHEIKKIVLDD